MLIAGASGPAARSDPRRTRAGKHRRMRQFIREGLRTGPHGANCPGIANAGPLTLLNTIVTGNTAASNPDLGGAAQPRSSHNATPDGTRMKGISSGRHGIFGRQGLYRGCWRN